jgi:drug/metabolite transporter (DMT)-like permease
VRRVSHRAPNLAIVRAPPPTSDHHAQSINPWGLVAMLTTLGAWTAAPLLMKHFTGLMDLWTMNGWRYTTAALCWAPLIVYQLARRTFPTRLWRSALLPSAFNCVGQVGLVGALYFTDATMLAFSLRVQLISVALGGALFFAAERRVIKEPRFLVGMALVLVGVVAYLLLHPQFGVEGARTLIGALLGATAGASFGAYALAVRPLMKQTGPMLGYAVISAYTALVMLILMLALGDTHGFAITRTLDTPNWILLIASAIIALVIGHPCYYAAIRSIGVSATATVLQLQPVTIGVASLLIFNITITPAQWGAGLVAIGAAVFMLRVQHNASKHDRATLAQHPGEPPAHEPMPEPSLEPAPDADEELACEAVR